MDTGTRSYCASAWRRRQASSWSSRRTICPSSAKGLVAGQQTGPYPPRAAVAVGDHGPVGADGGRGALGVEGSAREPGRRDDLDRRSAGSGQDDARGKRIRLPTADDAEVTVRTRNQPVRRWIRRAERRNDGDPLAILHDGNSAADQRLEDRNRRGGGGEGTIAR